MNDVEIAQKLYDEAAAAYIEASGDYEAAVMSTGASRVSEVATRYRKTGDESARALQRLVRARKAQAPSFETLLTDPAVQVDPTGDILSSIMMYTSAAPASAGLPVAGAKIYDVPARPARVTTPRRRASTGTGEYVTAGQQTAVS